MSIYLSELFYSLYCLCICITSFGTFPVLPVSHPIPAFYDEIPTFYADIPCYLGLYTLYCAWCVGWGGGEGWGVPCVARMRLQPCTWCYQGVHFNLLARYPIPGPSPAPVPAGEWGAELRKSSVSKISQRLFRCVHLPTLKSSIRIEESWKDLKIRAIGYQKSVTT